MPADDKFSTLQPGLGSEPTRGADVTPHDTNELPFLPRAVMVTVAGNVTVVWPAGNEQVIPMSANLMTPMRVKIIKSSGTTATGIKIFD